MHVDAWNGIHITNEEGYRLHIDSKGGCGLKSHACMHGAYYHNPSKHNRVQESSYKHNKINNTNDPCIKSQ